MKFESKIFNNIEYTLVDIYDWKTGEKIYHFASDEDYLFCFKKDENYIVIEEKELVQEIKDEYDLNPLEIWIRGKLPPEFSIFKGALVTKVLRGRAKREFKEEQIETLMKLQHGIRKETLEKRLANVDICIAKWTRKESLAFYSTATNSMYFREDDINKNYINAKRTRLHETIHAITGANSLLHAYSLTPGLVEGATENMVEKAYGNNTSSYENDIHFNLSKDASYKYLVSIIQQMEVALGKHCDRSILFGKTSFFKEFKEKYGTHAFRILNHRANKLKLPYKLNNQKQYFLDTQKMLMETVFDIDFVHVTNLEEAKEYFDKLLKYGEVRGASDEDNSYQEYYQKKLAEMKNYMKLLGYDSNELDIYDDKVPHFYPVFKSEDAMGNLYKWVAENLSKEIKNPQDISREILKYTIGIGQSEDENYYFLAKNNRIYKIASENRNTGERKEISGMPIEDTDKDRPLEVTVSGSRIKGYFVKIEEVNPTYLRGENFEKRLTARIESRLEAEKAKALKQKEELATLAIQQHFDNIMEMLEEVKQIFSRNRDGFLERRRENKGKGKNEVGDRYENR